MARNRRRLSDLPAPQADKSAVRSKSKFEVYGEEMIEKEVKLSGSSGRIYVPPERIGKCVKIIRVD